MMGGECRARLARGCSGLGGYRFAVERTIVGTRFGTWASMLD